MLRLTNYLLKACLLLTILTTAFSSVQARPSLTVIPVMTDSIPKPLPGKPFKDVLPPPPPLHNHPIEKGFIGSIREKMPLFPGCDNGLVYPKDKECADSLLLEFIYGNLRYPYLAWRDSVEGMAVISFYIEKDGAVTEAKIVRDPGADTGAEALRIINLMVEQNLRWTPGEQMDKPVRVRFNMPVKFKLTEKTVPFPPPPPPPSHSNADEPFKIVEQMPRFPGCEHLTAEEKRKECSDGKLLEYLHTNLKLTPLQVQSCVTGTAVIQFVVEADGSVTYAKIVRDVGAGYGLAALKAVESMNENEIRWIPGRQRGRAVRVEYNVPMRFYLE
ncbi:energy transducer TonB [Neolewinella persica]|uniref:energy transducer TonB n=1 Tax=Neolewinella persica TaxID=70998 RepID=UPI00039D92B2|nr:TonB family protein [Neolewinella persica]